MRINGNLVFNEGGGASSGEIQNAYIERRTVAPGFSASEAGRIYYNLSNRLYYFNDGLTWVPFATGGNAAALQAEVDATQASIGAAVHGNGAFNAAAFNAPIASATSITDAINQLATYAIGKNTLAELDDVNIPVVVNGQYLRFDGATSRWVADTLTLSDVSDVTVPVAQLNLLTGLTASAAELNILDGATLSTAELNVLDGITASTTELNFVDGVTAPIQVQLDGKQPLDATLTALAAFTGTGIVVSTGVDVFTHRSLVAPAEGIIITNADGVAGNMTFALANDLAALEGLTTTGYVVRTGNGAATTRIITGQAGRIVITNGDGVASNTDVDLATVTQGSGGSFLKVTLDAYGRVTQNTPVVTSDITALVDATYVNVAGDTMTGSLVMSGGATVTGVPTPVNASDAANKAYVDAVAEGLNVHAATQAAAASTDTNWATVNTAVYNNGTNGVGATLTLAIALTEVDGYTLQANDRILVKGFTGVDQFKNGIYVRTSPTVWTRASDYDTPVEVGAGDFVFNQFGTLYASSGFVQTVKVVTVGTDPVRFEQFSGQQTYVWGTGLVATGNQVDVRLGAGIFELPSDEVGIDLFSPLSGAIILTTDGTSRSTASISRLHLLLPVGSGLTQDATGLYIATNAITNAMILNDVHGLNADSGTGTLALGETLIVTGNSVQGINTSVSGQTFNVTAANASASQKGVASFDATEFSVTAGNVVLGTVPIAKLAQNTINFVGSDASADTVMLGESLTFVDGGHATQLPLVLTSVATNQVTVTLRRATTAALGVASFSDLHFNVVNGAVSLNASLDDLNNVSNADAAATGTLLRKTAIDWEPATVASIANDITLQALGNVDDTATPLVGHVLTGDGDSWSNQKIYHLHEQTTASATWVVNHGLSQQFCNVTVVDATNNVIIPNSITFDSANQLTVTFTMAITGHVIVMGLRTSFI